MLFAILGFISKLHIYYKTLFLNLSTGVSWKKTNDSLLYYMNFSAYLKSFIDILIPYLANCGITNDLTYMITVMGVNADI